jgi:hypothetical protein
MGKIKGLISKAVEFSNEVKSLIMKKKTKVLELPFSQNVSRKSYCLDKKSKDILYEKINL